MSEEKFFEISKGDEEMLNRIENLGSAQKWFCNLLREAPEYIVAKKEWGVGKSPEDAAIFDGNKVRVWCSEKLPHALLYEHYKEFCTTNDLKIEPALAVQSILEDMGVKTIDMKPTQQPQVSLTP